MSAWFNKALPYRLTQDVPAFTARGALGEASWQVHAELNKALHARVAREPAANELSTYGFAEPYPNRHRSLAEINEDPSLEDDLDDAPLPELVRPINNGEFLVIRAEQKYRQLPGQAVKYELDQRVAKIEYEQQRKVYKKERDQIKDEIITAFIPRAFVMRRSTFALIDTQAGLIWVQAQSGKVAEDLLSTLRECLGSLPIRPFSVKIAPTATFTEWVKKGECPADFYLLDSALLEDVGEDQGGKVALQRIDLTGDEAQIHTATGKQVTKVAVAYQDKLGFVVNDKVQFTKIAFTDLLKDQAEQDGGDDMLGQLDASFLLMGRYLREMLTDLAIQLGGEEIPQGT